MSIKFRFAGAVYHSRIDLGMTQAQAAEELGISLRDLAELCTHAQLNPIHLEDVVEDWIA